MRGRLILLALLLAATASCKREERDSRAQPAADESNVQATVSGLRLGGQPPPPTPEHERYTENAFQTGEGKRLFAWFNCSGCHANGGGGMGPPLMDDRWIYGSEPQNIYATIVEGRPNGMPSFRGKVPDSQVWQLPGRNDDMTPHPSEQSLPPQTPVPSSVPPASQGTG